MPASGRDQPDPCGERHPERDPGQREQRRERDRELDRARPSTASGPAGRHDAAEDADAVHPLRQRGAGGEHVGAAAGQADQPAGVDRQRVEQQLEVAGPVADAGRRGTASTSRCPAGRCR